MPKTSPHSRYRGVWSCRYKSSYQWAAKLKFNCETVNLPYSDSEEEAAMRYDAATLLLRGDQDPTLLNFPEGVPQRVMDETREFLIRKGFLCDDD